MRGELYGWEIVCFHHLLSGMDPMALAKEPDFVLREAQPGFRALNTWLGAVGGVSTSFCRTETSHLILEMPNTPFEPPELLRGRVCYVGGGARLCVHPPRGGAESSGAADVVVISQLEPADIMQRRDASDWGR